MRPIFGALATFALAGCGGKASGDPADGALGANAWAGPPGMRFTYVRRVADSSADTGAGNDTAENGDTAGADTGDTAGTDAFDRTRPLLLTSTADAWELRVGDDRWNHAEPYLTWALDRGDGFSVEGALLLPPIPAAGFNRDGLRVTDLGEVSVYGGTFPQAVSVERDAGAEGLAGSFVFARDVGPVVITTGEGRWEAARWEAVGE
jgi:hypothetical protein